MVLNLVGMSSTAIRREVTEPLASASQRLPGPKFESQPPEGRLPPTESPLQADLAAPGAAILPLIGLRLYEQPHPSGDPARTTHGSLPLDSQTHFAAPISRLPVPSSPRPRTSMIYGNAPAPRPWPQTTCSMSRWRGNESIRVPAWSATWPWLQQLVNKSVVEPFDHTFSNKGCGHFRRLRAHRRKTSPCTFRRPADGTDVPPRAAACIRCACRKSPEQMLHRGLCGMPLLEMRPQSLGGPRRPFEPRPGLALGVAVSPRRPTGSQWRRSPESEAEGDRQVLERGPGLGRWLTDWRRPHSGSNVRRHCPDPSARSCL